MSNSSYVNYTKISPHRNSPRNHAIDKITIHHMAGNISVETCGNVFQTREASSNYGIDSDGRVGMYVEEKDRSWASSSPSNDNRAVTIEVADNVYGGNWGCSNKAMTKLILLCADICKRNGIKQLNYTGDTSGNLTLHKWFISTDCPGAYLESQMPKIASEVNKVIQNGSSGYAWSDTNTDKPTPQPKNQIEVDGIWGPATTRKAQQVFKTVVDGEVSDQLKRYKNPNPGLAGGWEWNTFGNGGSMLIKAIQKWCGASVDGYIGPDTISKMQKKLNCAVIDGYVSYPSPMVKAFQTWLNKQ